jgi:hypothetical protein
VEVPGDVVTAFMFRSLHDEYHNETLCQIVSRAEVVDLGWGIEPRFTVRFGDGEIKDVLAQSLTPWYPV